MADGAKIDLPAHQHAYARFIRLAKIGVVVVALIAAGVVIVISR